MIDRQVRIRQSLRFHALRSIHHQQRALAGSERPRNFIGKINMPGRIDQIELVTDPVSRFIHHADGVRFNRDPALALEIHRVENLLLHFALGQRPGHLQQPVS